jgi:hypothetical protein
VQDCDWLRLASSHRFRGRFGGVFAVQAGVLITCRAAHRRSMMAANAGVSGKMREAQKSRREGGRWLMSASHEGGQKKQYEWDTCRAYHRRPTRARMSVVSSRVASMRDKITSHGPLVTSSG